MKWYCDALTYALSTNRFGEASNSADAAHISLDVVVEEINMTIETLRPVILKDTERPMIGVCSCQAANVWLNPQEYEVVLGIPGHFLSWPSL